MPANPLVVPEDPESTIRCMMDVLASLSQSVSAETSSLDQSSLEYAQESGRRYMLQSCYDALEYAKGLLRQERAAA